jgi:molybdopterin biosynthesis enzyme
MLAIVAEARRSTVAVEDRVNVLHEKTNISLHISSLEAAACVILIPSDLMSAAAGRLVQAIAWRAGLC